VTVGKAAVHRVVIGAYAVLLLATAPAWPDDWDGVGFVESVRDFDLARFRPHPPGYPVYVALLRIAALIVRTPERACMVVAVVSGVVATVLVQDVVRRAAGERAGWMAAILFAAAPGVWRACTGIGSEAPALACAALCAWGLVRSSTRAGPVLLGLGAGLGVGVRLSWAPLYLAALGIAPRGRRSRAWWSAGAATAAWVVGLVVCVGARRLWSLYAEQVAGHAARWGGTMITEPGLVRLLWLARGLFVDGLGAGSDPLGLVAGALIAVAAVQMVLLWRAGKWRGVSTAAALLVPYLLWIAVGQNLRDQPRHVLPLVAGLAVGLALPSARSRAATVVVGLLAIAASVRTALDAHARRTIPPPALQLVELARAQAAPSRLVVFGTASVRFFEMTELASDALVAGSLGDAALALTRREALPTRVWVTSEVGGLSDSRSPLKPIAALCRPPRLDRRMPCLDVYSWELPFLPRL
jgi:hypothetical protein